jgi:inosose dehydratase
MTAVKAPATPSAADRRYVPLGEGDVDIAAIVAALGGAGYAGWYGLEQDIPAAAPAGRRAGPDPVADVPASIAHLLAVTTDVPPAFRATRTGA